VSLGNSYYDFAFQRLPPVPVLVLLPVPVPSLCEVKNIKVNKIKLQVKCSPFEKVCMLVCNML
jgi:hypothetical protein